MVWIERYLSVCVVSVEALRHRGDKSPLEELMDDFSRAAVSMACGAWIAVMGLVVDGGRVC